MKGLKKKIVKCILMVTMLLMVFGSIPTFAATVGQILASPESGWRRYDNQESDILYTGKWGKTVASSYYNGSQTSSSTIGDTALFKFYGTKVRIITDGNYDHASQVKITIDGVDDYYTNNRAPGYRYLSYEKTGLSLEIHTVIITVVQPSSTSIDAIDIDNTGYLVNPIPSSPTNLQTTPGNSKVDLTWDAVIGATGYKVKRGTQPGVYDAVYDSGSNNFTNDKLESGITYYYVVTAVNSYGEGPKSNEVSAIPIMSDPALDVTSDVYKVKVGDKFTVDLVLRNGSGILAEDVQYTYDTNLFEYEGYTDVTGLKVQKEVVDSATGKVRFIVSSLGKNNIINGDKSLIQLKFKAKNHGKGKVDAIKGRIADMTTETDIAEQNCGEKTIIVEGTNDVNRSGEYTLVDLAIDSYYYGMVATDTDTTKYDADQVVNGSIDDGDLSFVVAQMLANSNYTPNN